MTPPFQVPIHNHRMDKVMRSADDAVALIPEGATLMVGGFGVCGNPENLIDALFRRGTSGLTVISNTTIPNGRAMRM